MRCAEAALRWHGQRAVSETPHTGCYNNCFFINLLYPTREARSTNACENCGLRADLSGVLDVNEKPNRMTRDALTFLPAKIVEGILLMLATSLYSDLFTLDANGAYVIVNTTVLFGYLVLAGWLTNACTRFVAEELKNGHGRSFYSTAMGSYLVITLSVWVVSGAAYALSGNGVWLAGAAMFSTYFAFQMLNAMLVQTGRIRWSVVLSISSAAIKLFFVLSVAQLLKRELTTPYAAIFAAVAGDLIASVFALGALGIPRFFSLRGISGQMLSAFLKFGFPLIGVSVAVGTLNMIDRYLIALFYDNAQTAVYGQNYSIASSIFNMIMAGVMRGVYPAVLGAWRQGGERAAKPLLDSGVRLYLLIAAPAAAGLAAVCYPLSRFIFFSKSEYHACAPVIALTAAAMFFMGLTEYANKAWELTKKTVPVLQNSAFAAAVKIVSSLILLPLVGVNGAAWGTLCAFISYFLLSALRARKIFLFSVARKSLANIALATAACFLAAWGVSHLPFAPVVTLILACAAGAGAYGIVILLTREAKDELGAFMKILRRR